MVALSSALIGYLVAPLKNFERVILGLAGLMMIKPGLLTDISGVIIFAAILFMQLRNKKS